MNNITEPVSNYCYTTAAIMLLHLANKYMEMSMVINYWASAGTTVAFIVRSTERISEAAVWWNAVMPVFGMRAMTPPWMHLFGCTKPLSSVASLNSLEDQVIITSSGKHLDWCQHVTAHRDLWEAQNKAAFRLFKVSYQATVFAWIKK